MTPSPLLHLESVSKSYGGVRALDDIHLRIEEGEVHAVCGENGAGKSTLIKILTGVVRPDRGTVRFRGQELKTGEVRAAEAAGIAVMHQESSIFPDLDAVDNIFVGREITRGRGTWVGRCWLDRAAMERQATELLSRLGETFSVRQPLGELPLAQRQMVSMARALAGRCRLLIMDEPTASLSVRETEVLMAQIRELRNQGISVLYVSHRLDEVFAISDRITVLRDGRWVATESAQELTRSQLIERMVGRSLDAEVTERREIAAHAPVRLRVDGLTRNGCFHDVGFEVRAGEILGLGGLVGAGRSEVVRALFGIDPLDAGTVEVDGRPLRLGSVDASLEAGVALVPEDRQHEGLVLPMSIAENVSLASLRQWTRWGCVSKRLEKSAVAKQLVDLQVKYSRTQLPAETLSGGNQQKLVLGKWLARSPRVLILDEPTRGIDVGAKSQFHALIRQLAGQGMAVVLISSELPELLALSDRILVMREGRVVGELSPSEATQEEILTLALPDGVQRKGSPHA